MVSARFRADETSAKLTWMGLTADTRRQRPAAAVRLAARSGVRVAAGHIIRDRSVLGVSRTVAISQHVPPSRFPGSTTVIPPVNAADLPNRQGPCLRNSSGCTPRGSDKRLYPLVTLGQKNWTFAPIWAVMTRREPACTGPRETAPALGYALRKLTEGADALPPPAREPRRFHIVAHRTATMSQGSRVTAGAPEALHRVSGQASPGITYPPWAGTRRSPADGRRRPGSARCRARGARASRARAARPPGRRRCAAGSRAGRRSRPGDARSWAASRRR